MSSNEKIRVLHITNMYPCKTLPTYGIFVKEQIDSLTHLRTPSGKAPLECMTFFIEGYYRRSAYVRSLSRIRTLIRRFTPSLIHAHYGYSGVVALVASLGYRAPRVISFCGDDLLGDWNTAGRRTHSSRVLASICRWSASAATAIIVKSYGMRNMLLPSQAQKAHVVPNGVDTTLFRPLDRLACRRALGLDPHGAYLLFGSDPSRADKNFPLAHAAWTIARRTVPQLQLLHLERVARCDVPILMNASNCVLLTSYSEGSPNVIKEAMSCGTPSICTRVGDAETLLDGVLASAVADTDPMDVASRIVDALQYDTHTNGPDKIKHLRLRITDVAHQILDVYRECLATPIK